MLDHALFHLQPQFHDSIRSGQKTSTVRDKVRCKPGDELSLRYWSDKPYRSKQIEISQVICAAVRNVQMTGLRDLTLGLVIDGQAVTTHEQKFIIARCEGFFDWLDMQEWFQKNKNLIIPGSAYHGQMCEWQPSSVTRM